MPETPVPRYEQGPSADASETSTTSWAGAREGRQLLGISGFDTQGAAASHAGPGGFDGARTKGNVRHSTLVLFSSRACFAVTRLCPGKPHKQQPANKQPSLTPIKLKSQGLRGSKLACRMFTDCVSWKSLGRVVPTTDSRPVKSRAHLSRFRLLRLVTWNRSLEEEGHFFCLCR